MRFDSCAPRALSRSDVQVHRLADGTRNPRTECGCTVGPYNGADQLAAPSLTRTPLMEFIPLATLVDYRRTTITINGMCERSCLGFLLS